MNILKSATEMENFFHPDDFPVKPTAKFITIVILRKSESELILRTDEGITKETTYMGFKDTQTNSRVIFSKRKATAPERRSGREFLRTYGLIPDECSINASMCGRCPDCITYGFAAAEKGGESKGSLKSRVLTEDAYSILPAGDITDIRTLNALSELETMMDITEKDGKRNLEMRESLNSVEYVKPETHFIDIETLRDIRETEFIYVFGNILRTTRYGAISSRMGKVSNRIVALLAGETEMFSSLQLAKMLWDELKPDQRVHPLKDDELVEVLTRIVEENIKNIPSKVVLFTREKLSNLIDEIKKVYQDPQTTGFVEALKNLKGI